MGCLGLLDPPRLLVPVALEVVGLGRALLAARRLVSGLELALAPLLGVPERMRPTLEAVMNRDQLGGLSEPEAGEGDDVQASEGGVQALVVLDWPAAARGP
jgi:hypothetical protein